MNNVDIISKRCSLLIDKQVFSLVILPTDNNKKTLLLFLWLLAWTVSGVIIITYYFNTINQNEKVMLLIWLAFWTYFEFKVARAFMWKKFGKEKLWIKQGILFYQQEINGKGKIKEYDLNLVSDIELIKLDNKSFADTINQSFWVKGGERISFQSQSQVVKFGMQLSDEEAKKILTNLTKFIRNAS